jgi:hypothetical protein
VAEHQVVPRPLRVEHGAEQLTPGDETGGGEVLGGHGPFDVAEGGQAEGVGQALGGVDGDDEDLAAQADGGAGRGGGGHGRLPDPAGAAEDDDLLGGQQPVERRHRTSSPRASASMRVIRMPSPRTNSSGR